MSIDQVLDNLVRQVLPCGLYLAGIIMATQRRRRHPRVSRLVIIACGTLLGIHALYYLYMKLVPPDAVYQPSAVAQTVYMIAYGLSKLSFIALGFAAIMDRKEPTADSPHGRAQS